MESEALAALKRNDGTKALDLYKKLASLGSAVACYCVGDIYLHGEGGVKSEPAEAKQWYERAFASAVPKLSQYAALKLGYIYGAGYDADNHYGAAVNFDKAFKYYKQLENSDIAIGLLHLGIMYEKGLGTPKDLGKALDLYRRAAKGGHVIARKCLGVLMVRNGDYVSGYLQWGIAVAEVIFFSIFKRNSQRLAML